MAIYLGNTKVSGSGVQVDSSFSDTSTRPVQNKVITDALETVGYDTWQKPADWIDMRNGALPNSVYFLVAHSADYATYPTFVVKATISNSGTYDVFVDGVKKATTASATETSLSWQTLALTSGFDVTYPAALRTHIIRVTPTVSTNTITAINTGSISNKGILWAHFTTKNYIGLSYFAQSNANPNASTQAPVWEAVTSVGNELNVSNLRFAFNCTPSIAYIPAFVAESNQNTTNCELFCSKTSVKHIKLVNVSYTGYMMFRNVYNVEKIELENCAFGTDNSYLFSSCSSLKRLPNIDFSTGENYSYALAGVRSLEDTFLDFSANTAVKNIGAYGTSTNPCLGIKGLTVSSSAPFNGSGTQIDIRYTGLDRAALVTLFNSLPTVTGSQICNITGATGAADLTAEDLAIATSRGWTITR